MTVVQVFELGRRDAAEVVEDASVVEPVDTFESGEFEIVEAAPGSLVANQSGLVEAVDRLGERVVIRIASGPDRLDNPVFGESLGVANRQILPAAVAVMNELVEIGAFALT